MSTDTVTGTYVDVIEDVEQRERDGIIRQYVGMGQRDVVAALDDVLRWVKSARGTFNHPYVNEDQHLVELGDGYLDDGVAEMGQAFNKLGDVITEARETEHGAFLLT